jgi:hypothetical protein
VFYGFLLFKNKIYTSFTLSQIFYLSLFSSPDPKGHVRYCHHLFGLAVSEEKIFLTIANQKQELPLAAIFVGRMGRNEENL